MTTRALQLLEVLDRKLPYDSSRRERARNVDLVILPNTIEGTNCGNCKFMDDNSDYCLPAHVDQPVKKNWCCALWDAFGVKRVGGDSNG